MNTDKGGEPVLRWNRSQEGYCTSKCGRFEIHPLYCGRVNPVFWKLVDTATGRQGGPGAPKRKAQNCFTQRKAKELAQRWFAPSKIPVSAFRSPVSS